MQVVTDLKWKTIAKFAKSSIADRATVQTDAYHSYRKPLAEKYQHEYRIIDADVGYAQMAAYHSQQLKGLCIRDFPRFG